MKYIIFFLITFSIYSKERIVVLDFVPALNVSRSVSISSSKYLISELNKTEEFSIIEKNQMQEVLKEIAFQQSGCTDTACEVKVGEMLAADKIVSGNIIKKDKKHIITIAIRNVKDKSLEFSETIDLYDLNKLEFVMKAFVEKIIYSPRQNNLLPEEDKVNNSNPKQNNYQFDLAQNRDDENKVKRQKDNIVTPLTKEESERIKKEQKKQNDLEVERQAMNRTILFPGWGHFYLNENKSGFIYSFLYATSLINCIYNYSYKDKKLMGETKKTMRDDRALYFYVNQVQNPEANNPIILYNLTEVGNSRIKQTASKVSNLNTLSAYLILGIIIAAVIDIKSINSEKQSFHFSIQPETTFAAQSISNLPKGSYSEFTYSLRF